MRLLACNYQPSHKTKPEQLWLEKITTLHVKYIHKTGQGTFQKIKKKILIQMSHPVVFHSILKFINIQLIAALYNVSPIVNHPQQLTLFLSKSLFSIHGFYNFNKQLYLHIIQTCY